jgi:ABC-type transport system involved in multi-copper enzyme maturation permease subunit
VFRDIFRFETRYQIRQPILLIALALFFLLSFGVVTTDSIQIGGSIGNVHRNAPFVIVQLLMFMSVFGVFFTTAFVANTVQRDTELQTSGIFYSLPIRKRDFLLGRFSGALVISSLVFLGVALGILSGSFMPWLEPERIGPTTLAPYLFGLIVFVLPNVFLSGSIFFSLATLTRNLMFTYAGVVVFFGAYGLAGTLLADLENETLAALIDPFGVGAFTIATKYWTIAERNSALPPLDSMLLSNRLLWLAVGAAILAFTYARFRMTVVESTRRLRRRRIAEQTEEAPAQSPAAPAALAAPQYFSGATSLRQFLRQTRLEAGAVLKGVPFLVIMLFGVLNLIGSSSSTEQFAGTTVYPVTHLLLQVINGSYLFVAIIIVTLYSGEMAWRERSLRLSEVFDALPVPTWVLWGSKLVALAAIIVILLSVSMLTAIGIQLYHGYHNFELPLYFQGLFLVVGIPFILGAVLALCIQAVVNNKYLGFLLMILYIISANVLGALDYDHNLYKYAVTPLAPYSDMNGYGHFVEPLFWFTLYWGFGAVLLGVLTHLFWVRGAETGARIRLALARQRLSRPAIGAAAAALLAFVSTGGFIYYNTNVLNEYVPGDRREARQAEFEKKYKQYEGLALPRITATYADVDIYPAERRVDIRGRYTVRNKTGDAIPALHLTLNPLLTVRTMNVPGARLAMEDAVLGYYIYELERPLPPAGEMEITFDFALPPEGFVNNDSNTSVVENGTFFSNFTFFPNLGYNRGNELNDPNLRREHGLPPLQRFPKVDDLEARRNNYVSTAADWVDFETVVSTSSDQIAIAPGYLQREWEENGRRYFHYKMDAPILNIYSYLSARYAVKRDRWNDVAIEVFYHPGHPYNVDRMIDAVKKSLAYFSDNFGPYQHRQFRIVEFPRYARFAQADPNTIPFSESIGFIARLDDDPEAIDTVFYVTAHEAAHQWWAHQVIGGFVQGATVMSETMAQYSALMVMEKEYGREKMRRFLKYELDAYLRGRGGELLEELPLVLVENQPYIHYRKGSLVMYALRDHVGEAALNAALARYIRDVKFQEPPYTNSLEFLSYIDDAVPPDRSRIVEDLFETITLYENEATEATWKRRDDGRYVVRLAVESLKFRADGRGAEAEISIDDWIDVAVFGAEEEDGPPEGRLLALEKRRIDGGSGIIEIVVDEEPKKAGIDPFNKLIDRNPENNIRKAEPA